MGCQGFFRGVWGGFKGETGGVCGGENDDCQLGYGLIPDRHGLGSSPSTSKTLQAAIYLSIYF